MKGRSRNQALQSVKTGTAPSWGQKIRFLLNFSGTVRSLLAECTASRAGRLAPAELSRDKTQL